MRRSVLLITGLILTWAAGAYPAGAQVVYVDVDATGPTHDGSSWCFAYTELHEALAVATEGTTVRVAEGRYNPDVRGLPDPRGATFYLLNNMTIVGGYAGCGALEPDERDVELHETILSGDLQRDDPPTRSDCCQRHSEPGCDDPACETVVCDLYPECCADSWDESCTLYATNLCPGRCTYDDNSYHVVTESGTGETAVLDGFTVTGGNADGADAHSYGGGMYSGGGSPTLMNCTFTANSADYGGGMKNYGDPTLTNCTFTGNWAIVSGGGMYNWGSPTLTNCAFNGNSAGQGGGVFNTDASPTLTNCAFAANSARNRGGGMYNSGSPTLTNCTFSGNSAGGGGGMDNHGKPTLTNCTFTGNCANRDAGGMYSGDSPTVINCILWGNSDSGGTDESAQIHGGTPSVDYSCVQGWLGGLGGTGNFGDDPLLVDPGYWDDNGTPGDPDDDFWLDGDYHLQAGSPCINTGSNDAPELPETDLDGHARILCGIVDMGAYEFGIGDCDCDQYIDLTDFTAWEVCMTGPDNGPYDPECEPFDFEYDGDVDLADFAAFANVLTGPR